MKRTLVRATILLCLIVAGASVSGSMVFSQATANGDMSRTSYEAEIYLLIASNQPEGKGDVPKVLESTVKQLGDTLPYKNYRLAIAWLGRLRDHGDLEIKGVANPKLWNQGTSPRSLYYELSLRSVRIEAPADSRASINIESFRFSTSMAIPEYGMRGDGTEVPVTSAYHNSGITSSLVIREGVPSVAGSFGTGSADDQMVVIVLVKRVS